MPPRDWAAAAPAAVAIWTEGCFFASLVVSVDASPTYRYRVRVLAYCCFDRNTFTFTFTCICQKYICHNTIRARRTTTGRNNHNNCIPQILNAYRTRVCPGSPWCLFTGSGEVRALLRSHTDTHSHSHTRLRNSLCTLTHTALGARASSPTPLWRRRKVWKQ